MTRILRDGRLRLVRLDVVRRRGARDRRRDRGGARAAQARIRELRMSRRRRRPRRRRCCAQGARDEAAASPLCVDRRGPRRARRRRRARAERVPVEPRVLLHARRRSPRRKRRTARAFRIGGLVEQGSLTRDTDALTVRFRVTDTAQTDSGGLHRAAARPLQGRQRRRRAGHARARRRRSTRPKCSRSTTRTTCRRQAKDAIEQGAEAAMRCRACRRRDVTE